MDLESDTKVKDNGKCNSADAIGKTELSPSPAPATKGRGLKKWRRIHRESGRETSNNFDSNRKRGMVALPVGIKQSEGSSSSTNAMSNVLGNVLDHISVYGDLSSRKGPVFESRADSDNSEDQNSRSSTAASAPRVVAGFNLIGKNSSVAVQVGDKRDKGPNAKKKPRGIKISKENSISSMESDSRSSNFVFLQAANSMTNNGRSNGGSRNYDEVDSDDARNGDTKFSKNEADYEDLAGDDSWEVKEEKVDDHIGYADLDPLIESIIPLHLAQEALEREVQKLRDVAKDDTVSSDDGFKPNDAHLQSKLEEAFIMLQLKDTKISELEYTLNSTKIKMEYEELLTRRIAAEVEYLVLSKSIQNLKMGRTDPTVEQKSVSTTATATEHEEEDAMKVKNRVWRYACSLIIQSVLLLVVLYVFVFKFSSKTVEVIPT